MENVKDYNYVFFVYLKIFFLVMIVLVCGLVCEVVVLFEVLCLLQEGEMLELCLLSFFIKVLIQFYKSWFFDFCEGYGDEYVYYNWFIYLNVNFCSVCGEYFLFQQYDLVVFGEIDYYLWMMIVWCKDLKIDFSVLLSILICGECNVIGEDILVLECFQEGLGVYLLLFMYGDYEVQLVCQYLWYCVQVLGERV